ncbi:hypothetical protein ACQP00_17790 [Dactylosporangium sp. CS-047395]|uniref:hypothetical protein n=1 Tax=Dactylosporangium sp. CS-047395 TaxID=3239936 RepID=UPI003D924327
MDEHNFRASLRDALEHSNQPPGMRPEVALAEGRRAARRRTAAIGGAGVGVLAALTAVGVAATAGGAPAGQQAAGPGRPSVAATAPAPAGTAGPSPVPIGSDTKEVWPTGPDGTPQGDRTARAGVKYDKANALLEHLLTLVPAGYTAADDKGGDNAIPSRNTQAQFEDRSGGKDRWSYLSSVEIRKDGRAGQIVVSVYEPGLRNTGASGPCDLQFWSKAASCKIVKVGGKDVAVATGGEQDDRIDRWAGYIHPDGTVVYVALSRYGNFGLALDHAGNPLEQLPFDDQQLAALALDPALHITA